MRSTQRIRRPERRPRSASRKRGSRRSAPGTPAGAARRTERDACHRLPYRRRADARDRRRRPAVGRRAAVRTARALRRGVRPCPPLRDQRAARPRRAWSARFFASRTTRPAPPASSSSTTSAISACAATGRSASPRRSRIWAGFGPGAIGSKRLSGSSAWSCRRRLRDGRERRELPSLRAASVEVAGLGRVRGDVAWGGNWFFLTETAPCDLVRANAGELTQAATAIRDALAAQGVTGKDGAAIDHIEMFAPAAIG